VGGEEGAITTDYCLTRDGFQSKPMLTVKTLTLGSSCCIEFLIVIPVETGSRIFRAFPDACSLLTARRNKFRGRGVLLIESLS
jgi:hypothetical protein